MQFDRGPYGEILPPPLLAGLDPADWLAALQHHATRLGSPITVPTRGKARRGMEELVFRQI